MIKFQYLCIDDFEPFIKRERIILEVRFCNHSISKEYFSNFLKELSNGLGMNPHPELPEPIITSATGHSKEYHNGFEAMYFWLESGMHAYLWEDYKLLTIDMHSCANLDEHKVIEITEKYFNAVEVICNKVSPHNIKKDSIKIEVCDHSLGKGLFANQDIAKGEFVVGCYGQVYKAEKASQLPKGVVNHGGQFDKNKRRDSEGYGNRRNSNHSCDPNCGLQGMFDLVTIRDIKAGEEITHSYSLFENSDWIVPGGKCLCKSEQCLGSILPYNQLPEWYKEKYKEYTSPYLLTTNQK